MKRPFKILLLGDKHIGKSTFVKSLLNLQINIQPTIIVSAKHFTIKNRDVILWDTSGDLSYELEIDNYYINKNFVILAFDPFSLITILRLNHILARYKFLDIDLPHGILIGLNKQNEELPNDNMILVRNIAKSLGFNIYIINPLERIQINALMNKIVPGKKTTNVNTVRDRNVSFSISNKIKNKESCCTIQ
ncbi:MAG: hypothetical protein JKX76_01640 [Colwellia sp.]|nr:hypothetical protein [Colwellia sp.]